MYPSMRCEWCGAEVSVRWGAREWHGAMLCSVCLLNPEILVAVREGRGLA